jgi:hypothetical protein
MMWRRTTFTLTAVGALAALAAVVPAADAEAQTTTEPAWHISAEITNPPSGLISLYQMTAVRGEAWAAGQGGQTGYGPQIDEWTGSTGWINRTPAHINDGSIQAIGMSGPDNVWAAAGDVGNYALRWNGEKWTRFNFHTTVGITGLAVLSTTDVWIFGNYGEFLPYVHHYDGHSWHSISTPIVPLQVSGVSAHDIWIVGSTTDCLSTSSSCPSTLAQWNGWRWHTVNLPNLHLARKQSFQPMGITALSPKDVWVVGEVEASSGVVNVRSILLNWNGKRWSLYRSPVNNLAQVTSDGQGGIWMTADPGYPGQAYFLHFRNGKWSVVLSPQPIGQGSDTDDMYGIVNVPGTTQVWAGGWIGPPDSYPLGAVEVFSP